MRMPSKITLLQFFAVVPRPVLYCVTVYDQTVCNCYSAGAAYKDGRLRPGDQILEVMKEDLRNVTHSFALHALRQTPNKVRYL
jgi:hypothetical protein